MSRKKMIEKICVELAVIREELRGIRESMESRPVDADLIIHEIAEGLEKSFSAMGLS